MRTKITTDDFVDMGSVHDAALPGDMDLTPEKLAIVGMACRAPGNVSSPEELWEMCARARSGWSEIPKKRFSAESFYHPDPERKGTHNVTGGHFLEEDISLFDARLFNLTSAEVISMDPQQRLLLEVTFEALENAGITMAAIKGRNVGVFVGGYSPDYSALAQKDTMTTPMYLATGTSLALLSNRISYFFDLRGPSITVDCACSSSLVALHLACQSLRSGESNMAIVGGVHLNMIPDSFLRMSVQR